MKDLIYSIMKLEDSTALMPILLEYFKADVKTKEELDVRRQEADDAIDELKRIEVEQPDKSGLIRYYIREIESVKRLVV